MKLVILIFLALLHPCMGDSHTFDSTDADGLLENTTMFFDDSYNMSDQYEETIRFENIIGTVVPTIFALVVVVGLIGNLLVILVVCKNHQMQNSTNTLIINLALSDLLFLILCVPFTAADYALPIWVFSRAWCRILQYLQFVSAYASVWTLVLMSFDRFLAVVFPVRSMTLRSVKNTLICIVILWLVIVTTNLPMAFIHDIHTYYFIREDRSTCTFVAQLTRSATDAEVRAYYFTFNTLGYALPLGIACVLYVFMLRRLWFGMPMFQQRSKKQVESMKAKKKVTFMVTGVIVTFAICWLPLNICFFLTGATYQKGEPQDGIVATWGFVIFQFMAQILAYSNSCLNPILYAFLSENFRKGFIKLFEFIGCCKPVAERILLQGEFKLRNGTANMDFERTEFPMTTSSNNNLNSIGRNSVARTNSVYYPSRQPSICAIPEQPSNDSIGDVDFGKEGAARKKISLTCVLPGIRLQETVQI